jgi:hypothetical protein
MALFRIAQETSTVLFKTTQVMLANIHTGSNPWRGLKLRRRTSTFYFLWNRKAHRLFFLFHGLNLLEWPIQHFTSYIVVALDVALLGQYQIWQEAAQSRLAYIAALRLSFKIR